MSTQTDPTVSSLKFSIPGILFVVVAAFDYFGVEAVKIVLLILSSIVPDSAQSGFLLSLGTSVLFMVGLLPILHFLFLIPVSTRLCNSPNVILAKKVKWFFGILTILIISIFLIGILRNINGLIL